jgi:hypothetical protein
MFVDSDLLREGTKFKPEALLCIRMAESMSGNIASKPSPHTQSRPHGGEASDVAIRI